MEDEVDVDIEGDEFENNIREPEVGVLSPERLIRSEWSSAAILPWQLDSTISSEDREAIETMLLEEEYYLTGGGTTGHIWESDGDKVTKLPTKPSSTSSTRWSPQEKELFAEGLAQFGRRWTKIARLVGSRSTFQVKSYARQFFKHQTTSEPRGAAPPTGGVLQLHPQSSGHASAPSNAVHTERLSDGEDEEVDITDDLDGGVKAELREPGGGRRLTASRRSRVRPCCLRPRPSPLRPQRLLQPGRGTKSPSPPEHQRPQLRETRRRRAMRTRARRKVLRRTRTLLLMKRPNRVQLMERRRRRRRRRRNWYSRCLRRKKRWRWRPLLRRRNKLSQSSLRDDHPRPLRDILRSGTTSWTSGETLKSSATSLQEHVSPSCLWGFFRLRSKPRYLNKTSVRPGLKNCGDVNCIGRIHTYLELVGAINFHCEQAVYNRPRPVDRSKHREGRDVMEAYQLAQRLQSMRTRKRRVRDTWGNWCDSKDLEGQTYEHLSAEELALRREERKRNPKPCKVSRFRGSFDPFQLIPCRSFGEDVQEPFQVIVCAESLLIMDMHAHVSRCEVIGLLGGAYDEEKRVLKIRAAEPCNSVSTGLQCEMDPVSQTQARDLLSSLGLAVVGWYHSHPSFQPNPSVRDINTQDQFQSYFSRGGAPFIGMIVSPYDPASPSPHSQTTCLQVRGSQEPSGPPKLPYRFDFLSSQDVPDWEQTLRRAQWIIHRYRQAAGSVQMDGLFRRDSHLTCLEKMLSSLARYLEPLPDEEGDAFLTEIQARFLSHFMGLQRDEDASLSARAPADSDEEEKPRGGGSSDTAVHNTSSVALHLGSVLSSEYDYLL